MPEKRLTIGMRCRFRPKRSSWKEYTGHECLLQERSGKEFSVMVLAKGKNVRLEKEKTGVVINQVAWVAPGDLEYVDSKFKSNLDFMDWYEEHEEDFCGDCGAWFPGYSMAGEEGFEEARCPNEKCPGNLFADGLCPCCEAPEPKRGRYCKKCGFDWELGA